MGRIVPAGTIVRDQLDLYVSPGHIERAMGVVVSNLQSRLFVDNAVVTWPLTDGSLVFDSSVCSGKIYFNEISGSPGFYSIRFFPDRVGFWRLVLTSFSLNSEKVFDFDVVNSGFFSTSSAPSGGLSASFIKP